MYRSPLRNEALAEVRDVNQNDPDGFRRWFSNNYFDVIVWYKKDRRTLLGFQVCYNRGDPGDHALTWTYDHGYSHNRIDDGEQGSAGGAKMAPVLIADGAFDFITIANLFRDSAARLERELANFIYNRIKNYDRPHAESVPPLSEFANVGQVEGQGFRRWFSNNDMDLIVWYMDDKTTLLGFQLRYGSRALTWTQRNGYEHNRIDDGDVIGRGMKMAPILVADGTFDSLKIANRFRDAATTLDEDLANFIFTKITGYR